MDNPNTTKKKDFTDYVVNGIFFLFLLIVTALLFLNESNYIKTEKSIRDAEGAVMKVEDVSVVDAALDGKVIYASAFAGSKETLTDGLYGVSETALCLRRKVEYYQFEEKSQTKNRKTTYSHYAKWAASPISSKNFHSMFIKNFVLVKIEQKSMYAK